MAMIKCVECGKEFSDRASSCPNCGCPTEYILKELESIKCAENHSFTEKYDILGSEFLVTKKLRMSIILRITMRNMNDEVEADAYDFYHSMKTVDELIEKLPEHVSLLMDTMLESAINLLIKMGIYDLDKEAFFQKYYLNDFNAEPVMSSLVERYVDILGYEEELKQYREYIKKVNRSRWSGGGFGVVGAIKGSITAQLMNIGNGFLHALPEHTQRVNDEYTVKQKKERMLKDSETYKTVLTALQVVADGIYNCMTRELAVNGAIAEYNYNTVKADSLLNNYSNLGNEAKDSVSIKILRDAFFADPSYYRVYFAILCTEYDKSGDVQKLADELGYTERLQKDYEMYESQYLEDLKESYEEELDEICEASRKIYDNKTLFSILDKCFKISKEIGYTLEDEIMCAITNRLHEGISHSDAGGIKSYLDKNYFQLEDEFVSRIARMIDKAENMRGRAADWDKIKKATDGYMEQCEYSALYLLEVYHKALSGDIAAQDVFYLYIKGETLENGGDEDFDKHFCAYESIVSVYGELSCDYEKVYGDIPYDDFESSPFFEFWDGLDMVFSSDKHSDGIQLLQRIKNVCPLAYYILAICDPQKKIEYLEKAVERKSRLALGMLIKIVKKEKTEEVNRYCISIGFKDEFTCSYYAYGLGTLALYGKFEYGEDRFELYFKALENLEEAFDIRSIIEKADAYCKERFGFKYLQKLKNGSVRYLMNDELGGEGYYARESYYLPFIHPQDISMPLYSYVLWDIYDRNSKEEILLTNRGISHVSQKGNQYIAYKNYIPGSIKYESFSATFVETVIAFFKVLYYVSYEYKTWDDELNPYSDDKDYYCDFVPVSEKEPFEDEINNIFELMEQNQFREAAKKAYNLSGGKADTTAYTVYVAILKVVREQIQSDWFECYKDLVMGYSIDKDIRSDLALEGAKLLNLLTVKKMREPADSLCEGYIYAAFAGRHEAMECLAKLCECPDICSHKEWADVWRQRIADNPDKTSIFDYVEKIWVNNGNPIPDPLDKVIQQIKVEKPKQPYYGYDEINTSHHWYILLQYSKLFKIWNEGNITGFYKGTGVYKNGGQLDKQIRGFYEIPQNDVIYIMQDAAIFGKSFSKGVIFTDKAVYVKNKRLEKIRWEDFSKSDYSFGLMKYAIKEQKFEMTNPEGVIKSLLENLADNVIKNVTDNYVKNYPHLDMEQCYEDKHFSAPSKQLFHAADMASNTANGKKIPSVGKITCPNCNKELKEGTKFCNFCGAKIEKKKACVKCGREISSSAKFCNFCGEPIK